MTGSTHPPTTTVNDSPVHSYLHTSNLNLSSNPINSLQIHLSELFDNPEPHIVCPLTRPDSSSTLLHRQVSTADVYTSLTSTRLPYVKDTPRPQTSPSDTRRCKHLKWLFYSTITSEKEPNSGVCRRMWVVVVSPGVTRRQTGPHPVSQTLLPTLPSGWGRGRLLREARGEGTDVGVILGP